MKSIALPKRQFIILATRSRACFIPTIEHSFKPESLLTVYTPPLRQTYDILPSQIPERMASSDFSTSSNSSNSSSNYASASAPLPSPSSSQPAHYFPSQPSLHNRNRSLNPTGQTQPQAPTSQTQPYSQQHVQQPQQHASQAYAHEPHGGGQAQEGCLIAEAAKRAQVQIAMRDMAELSL